MELWCDIFHEDVPQLRNRFVMRRVCAAKFLVLTSIGGRQLQCLTSPKEQIVVADKNRLLLMAEAWLDLADRAAKPTAVVHLPVRTDAQAE